MFEKRLKTLLVILLVVTGLLMLRALQLQVFERGQWVERAARVGGDRPGATRRAPRPPSPPGSCIATWTWCSPRQRAIAP